MLPVKNLLPVITKEVGDTWMYGAPSDPLKMAQSRELQRVWTECLQRERQEKNEKQRRSGQGVCLVLVLVLIWCFLVRVYSCVSVFVCVAVWRCARCAHSHRICGGGCPAFLAKTDHSGRCCCQHLCVDAHCNKHNQATTTRRT